MFCVCVTNAGVTCRVLLYDDELPTNSHLHFLFHFGSSQICYHKFYFYKKYLENMKQKINNLKMNNAPMTFKHVM